MKLTAAEAFFKSLYAPQLTVLFTRSDSDVHVDVQPVSTDDIQKKLEGLANLLLGSSTRAEVIIRGPSDVECIGMDPVVVPIAIAALQPFAIEYYDFLARFPPREVYQATISYLSQNFLLTASLDEHLKTLSKIPIRMLCGKCTGELQKKLNIPPTVIIPGVCESDSDSPLGKTVCKMVCALMRSMIAEFLRDRQEHVARKKQSVTMNEFLASVQSFSITVTATEEPGEDGQAERRFSVRINPFFDWKIECIMLHWLKHHCSFFTSEFAITLHPVSGSATKVDFEGSGVPDDKLDEIEGLGSLITVPILRFFKAVSWLASAQAYEAYAATILSGLRHLELQDITSFIQHMKIVFVCEHCINGRPMKCNKDILEMPGQCSRLLSQEVNQQLNEELSGHVRRILLKQVQKIALGKN